jgi:hypothetical protein
MIGNSLTALFDASMEWQTFRERLHLSGDTDPIRFWESLFRLFADMKCSEEQSHPVTDLLRTMLWKREQGMARLLTEREALPTGLSGDYRALTRAVDIRYYADDALETA